MVAIAERRERAARARAARAYAGLSQPELAERLQISVETLSRLENARKSEITLEELWAIADVCDVPRDFVEFGWVLEEPTSRPAGSPDVERRLAALETQLAALRRRDARLEELQTQLRRLGDQIEGIGARGSAAVREPQTLEGSLERLLDLNRAVLRDVEQQLGQRGRDIGRRDLQSRRAKDRLPTAQPAASSDAPRI